MAQMNLLSARGHGAIGEFSGITTRQRLPSPIFAVSGPDRRKAPFYSPPSFSRPSQSGAKGQVISQEGQCLQRYLGGALEWHVGSRLRDVSFHPVNSY